MNKIFSKDKDWVLLIGYIAFIYATLPYMPRVVSFFFSLLGRYFYITATAILMSLLVMIFTSILRRKSVAKDPVFYAAAAIILALYLFFILFATPIVAEKMHLLEYGFLSYLALRVVKGAQSHAVIARSPAQSGTTKQSLHVVLIIVIVGYVDELIQGFTPGRYYEIKDVALNIVSGILGLFVLKLLECSRRLTNPGDLLQ